MLMKCTTPYNSNPTTLDDRHARQDRNDRQIPRPFALYERHWVDADSLTHPDDAIAWGLDTPRAAYVFLRHPDGQADYLGRYASAERACEVLSRHGELAIVWPEREAAWPAFILDDLGDLTLPDLE